MEYILFGCPIHSKKLYRQASATQYFYIIVCGIIFGFLNNASASTEEYIVGGDIAKQADFKYQAIVIGKRNFNDAIILFGSGAIISDYFVLSAAQCVFSADGHLKQFSFSIAVGTEIVKRYVGIFLDVEQIFVASYDADTNLNDLAVIQTTESFNFTNNRQLQALNLPYRYESFEGSQATVSGYGYHKVDVESNIETRANGVRRGESDDRLRSAIVIIASNKRCKKSYPSIHVRKQMCGIIPLGISPGGVCMSDIGSPLVIGQTIVGIASKITLNCDDSLHGCIYTKVSAYTSFIQSVMNGTVDVVSYANHPHISRTPNS